MNNQGIYPEYVFHDQTDPLKPQNSSTFNRTWKTTIRTMDILAGAKVYRNRIVESALQNKDALQPYGLRHTYCTMLTNCNIGEYFKKRLMGHTLNGSITDGVYTHCTLEDIIKASKPIVMEFDRIFDSITNPPPEK